MIGGLVVTDRLALLIASLGLAVALGGAGACGDGDASGNDAAPPDAAARGLVLSVAFSSNDAGTTAQLPADLGTVTVESAVLWIGDLRFVGDGDDGGRTERRDLPLDLGQPFALALPDAPPGLYSRLRIVFDAPGDRTLVPAAFEGHRLAFQIRGHLRSGAAFVVRDEHDLALDLRAGDGRELAPGQTLGASLAIDLPSWFAGVELGDAKTGTVVIDASTASDRLERFRANFVRAARLVF